MKIETIDGSTPRIILGGMLFSNIVCGRIASRWKPPMFVGREFDLIGGWAVAHHQKHGKAPKNNIKVLLSGWAEKTGNEDQTDALERLLAGVCRDWQNNGKVNSAMLVDTASNYFNKQRLVRNAEKVLSLVEMDRIAEADEVFSKHTSIRLGVGGTVDFQLDKSLWEQAFTQNEKPLFTYPGELGKFINQELVRDYLLAFMGPDKSGKSFMLLDVVYRALQARCKVILFEAGDMSMNDIGKRIAARMTQAPYRLPYGQKSWPAKVKWPSSIIHHPDKEIADVVHETRSFAAPLQWQDGWESNQRFIKIYQRSKLPYFKLRVQSAGTLSVSDIRDELEGLKVHHGWTPDCVVVDYADILAPPPGKLETRDQHNRNWIGLRSISMDYHCLLVTATQTDADAYGRLWLSRKNFSEDKRKLAEVNGMIGINITPEEKEQNLMRLNWIVKREGHYDVQDGPSVASCLAFANPTVKSCWK